MLCAATTESVVHRFQSSIYNCSIKESIRWLASLATQQLLQNFTDSIRQPIESLLQDLNDDGNFVSLEVMRQKELHSIVEQIALGDSIDLTIMLHEWGQFVRAASLTMAKLPSQILLAGVSTEIIFGACQRV